MVQPSRTETPRCWRRLRERQGFVAQVLTFSTLFPNAAQPNHGVFVENRLKETLALGGIEATVVAPVPFFPFAHRQFGRYAAFARAPLHEVRHEVEIWHPRYVVVPKCARFTPEFLYRTALASVRALQAKGWRFDVIDAHYFYPDGVAAARLADALKLPLVITGRGTDLTLIPNAAGPRAQIRWAACRASALVTVCDDLRRRLVDLGAPEQRVLVLRNGVDLGLFTPGDREAARAAWDLKAFTWLSVGSLIDRKGHQLAIEALIHCPDCMLVIAGDGPLRLGLDALARRLGVRDRVRFLGEVPHSRLPDLYAAADILVLASSREGWANVLLEAMACGTPVAATAVNGTVEVVCAPAAGALIPQRTVASLVETLVGLRARLPSREATRRYAEGFGWPPIGRANKALLNGAAALGYEHRFAGDIVEEARRYLMQ
jgi:glycosyltransferase involved in cell wall biosynthesis